MTTIDLPEFDVSVKMARKTGPNQTEYRTFTARVPAVDQQHAEAAAYGLGNGINDASRYAWKFADTDPNVSAEPASDTAAKVAELTADIDDRDSEISTLRQDLDLQTKAAWDNNSQVAKLTAELADTHEAHVKTTREFDQYSVKTLDRLRDELAKANAALTQSRAQAATYANEIGTLTAENARVRQQRDEQQTVIDAAKAWRWSGDTADGHRRAEAALMAAVDALPKAEATR